MISAPNQERVHIHIFKIPNKIIIRELLQCTKWDGRCTYFLSNLYTCVHNICLWDQRFWETLLYLIWRTFAEKENPEALCPPLLCQIRTGFWCLLTVESSQVVELLFVFAFGPIFCKHLFCTCYVLGTLLAQLGI